VSVLVAKGQDSTRASNADTVVFSSLDLEGFEKLARFENKPYIIFFTASWCAPCHRIKNEIFTNDKIASIANSNYLAYNLDIESFDGADANRLSYHISQLPTLLVFDPRGKQLDKAIGYFDGYYLFKKLRAHIPPSKWGKDWNE